jgi:hypothetical protein
VIKPSLSTDSADVRGGQFKSLGKPGDNSPENRAQLGIPMWITTRL